MKSLTEFAKQPQLIEMVLDSDDIIAEYGEPIVFYMKDYVGINTYFDFFRAQSDKGGQIDTLLRMIVLNEKGEPALDADKALPVDIAVAVLAKVNENMGKSKTKPLMNETGNPQS